MFPKPKATIAIAQQSPYACIFAVNMACIPVMSTERGIARKQQALLARQLFKRLGIKGVSVTAPNYSMAQSVHVSLPEIAREQGDYLYAGTDYRNHCYSDMPLEVPARAKANAKHQAELRIGEILDRAFPNHDNRSDYQTDYFDSCWSIN